MYVCKCVFMYVCTTYIVIVIAKFILKYKNTYKAKRKKYADTKKS